MAAHVRHRRLWTEGCWMRVKRKQLVAAMQKQDMSCRKLAAETGLHPSTIARLWSGAKKDCSPDTALIISGVLDKPWSSLFTRNLSSAVERNDARLMTGAEMEAAVAP